MGFIIVLYLCADVWLHKGQVRVLFPKTFTEARHTKLVPQSKTELLNSNKQWKKGINTREQIGELDTTIAGFECDVYFDSVKYTFNIQHDADKSTGFKLDDLLKTYQERKLQSSIWLDVKNLDESNAEQALAALIAVRNKFSLQNKLLVESVRPGLLTSFSDSGFFTSYYVPFFNPYKISKAEMNVIADSIALDIGKAKINALSGYYFQYSFLNHYFPRYPVLTWADHAPFSLVNYLFSKKLDTAESVFIVLKP